MKAATWPPSPAGNGLARLIDYRTCTIAVRRKALASAFLCFMMRLFFRGRRDRQGDGRGGVPDLHHEVDAHIPQDSDGPVFDGRGVRGGFEHDGTRILFLVQEGLAGAV